MMQTECDSNETCGILRKLTVASFLLARPGYKETEKKNDVSPDTDEQSFLEQERLDIS